MKSEKSFFLSSFFIHHSSFLQKLRTNPPNIAVMQNLRPGALLGINPSRITRHSYVFYAPRRIDFSQPHAYGVLYWAPAS
jgi:hypothetical protein